MPLLPVELVLMIGGYTDTRDRLQLARTCRYHYHTLIRWVHTDALSIYVCHGKQSVPAWAATKNHWRLVGDLLDLLPLNHEFPLDQFTRILDRAVLGGQLGIVERVFEKAGTMLDSGNAWQVLHSAVMHDRFDIARFLVDKGIDAYTAQQHGENPMHKVALSGDLAMARLLLRAGITVAREVSRTGRTSVHYAAAAGNVDMVELLIRAGANIFSTDVHRRTVLFNAAVAGIDDASSTKIKESRIVIPTPSAGSAEVMKLLLWHGRTRFHEISGAGLFCMLSVKRDMLNSFGRCLALALIRLSEINVDSRRCTMRFMGAIGRYSTFSSLQGRIYMHETIKGETYFIPLRS